MFDNLRNAFSKAAKSFSEKELKEKDIKEILFELEISLLESDVASEIIDAIKSDLMTKLIGAKVDKKQIAKFVRDSLISNISTLFDSVKKIDLLQSINEKRNQGLPFLILFVGINGTGKTTSLAKLAYMLKQEKYSIVIAASDTFRAGAIEQLREHANRLNLKLVAQNYESDPAAVARDAVLYAKSHKTDCVLIDTAGRMQTSKNLMEQISKINKVINPDMTIFVGDSLAGNDTVNQAREFFEHVKFNASILTKSDADAKGGAALSIVKATGTPILYVGVGQEYADLKAFSKETFLQTIFDSDADKAMIDTRDSIDTRELETRDVIETRELDTRDSIDTRELDTRDVIETRELETRDVIETRESDTRDSIDTRELDTRDVIETRELETRDVIETRESDTRDVIETRESDTRDVIETRETINVKDSIENEKKINTTDSTNTKEKVDTKDPIGSVASKPDTKEPETPASKSTDPFEGITDKEITTFSELYSIAPPENDEDAIKIGNRIRQWIKQGKPNHDK